MAQTTRSAPALSVTLFGSTLFHDDGQPLQPGLKGTTIELLWYLAVNAGQAVRRECVADLFWQNSSGDRQRSALSSAIWRIGKKLPRHPGLRLNATSTTLCMTIDPSIPVDARELCAAVREACGPQGMTQQAAVRVEAALAATDAPFMDGFDADWTLAERERISNIRIRGMIALMHWHGGNRNYEDALEIGRGLLHEDPFREAVQIDMMWLYVLNGQRVQAIKQYEAFAAILRNELSIEPMRETQALYVHIRNDLDRRPQRSTADGPAALGDDPAHASLALGLAAAEQSRREFYQTLRAQLG
jgi:DNA-binding SARP family transcriptional activator